MSKVINFIKISLSLLLITSCAHKFENADLVVHNAKIFTSSINGHQEFQAMAIKNGTVIDIGPERDILNKYNSKKQYDARKRIILPGFIPVFNTTIIDSNIFWENGYTSFILDSLNLKDYQSLKMNINNALFSISCNSDNIEENILITKNDSLINKIIYLDSTRLNTNYSVFFPDVLISNQINKNYNFKGQQYTFNHWKQNKYNIVHIKNYETVVDTKSFTVYFDNNISPFNLIEKLSKNKSVLNAIDNFTLNSAILNNIYDNYGSLEIGKKANFITLDYNILKAEINKISKIKILHTYVEGKLKYTKY